MAVIATAYGAGRRPSSAPVQDPGLTVDAHGMNGPIVGITMASLSALEGVDGRKHPDSSVVGRSYVQAVALSGGVPWPVPVTAEPGLLRSIWAHLDGLVLTGGSDIRPGRYGGRIDRSMDDGDPERDEVEAMLASWAMQEGKPLLGICRGMQTINVSRGGTLVPDLAGSGRAALKHDYYPLSAYPRDWPAHQVRVMAGTRTEAALGTTRMTVNSIHHQAVDQLAHGLEVTAIAPDGVVEALEDPGLPFCMGVQWHPEEMHAHPSAVRLFDSLLDECARRAARRPAFRPMVALG